MLEPVVKEAYFNLGYEIIVNVVLHGGEFIYQPKIANHNNMSIIDTYMLCANYDEAFREAQGMLDRLITNKIKEKCLIAEF